MAVRRSGAASGCGRFAVANETTNFAFNLKTLKENIWPPPDNHKLK